MKKILSVFFSLILLFSLAGCGSSEEKISAYKLESSDLVISAGGYLTDMMDPYVTNQGPSISDVQYLKVLQRMNDVMDNREAFEKLKVPSEYKEAHKQMVSAYTYAFVGSSEMVTAYETNNNDSFTEALSYTELFYDEALAFMDILQKEK